MLETCWDSTAGVLQWVDVGFLGRTGWKGRRRCCLLYERAVGMHGALPQMDVEPVENIWVRIRGQMNMGDVMVCLPQTAGSGSR